jgi:hypothetical protein
LRVPVLANVWLSCGYEHLYLYGKWCHSFCNLPERFACTRVCCEWGGVVAKMNSQPAAMFCLSPLKLERLLSKYFLLQKPAFSRYCMFLSWWLNFGVGYTYISVQSFRMIVVECGENGAFRSVCNVYMWFFVCKKTFCVVFFFH